MFTLEELSKLDILSRFTELQKIYDHIITDGNITEFVSVDNDFIPFDIIRLSYSESNVAYIPRTVDELESLKACFRLVGLLYGVQDKIICGLFDFWKDASDQDDDLFEDDDFLNGDQIFQDLSTKCGILIEIVDYDVITKFSPKSRRKDFPKITFYIHERMDYSLVYGVGF